MMKSDDNYQPPSFFQSVLAHLRLDLPLFECHGTVQTSLFLTFILSRVNPDPVCHTGNFLKSLFGLCVLRHCGHNTQKIISPANQNLPVLTANHKITWWLHPQTPSEKLRFYFLRNDIRTTGMIWKRYHIIERKVRKKRAKALITIHLNTTE